jgi:hypothetical protein
VKSVGGVQPRVSAYASSGTVVFTVASLYPSGSVEVRAVDSSGNVAFSTTLPASSLSRNARVEEHGDKIKAWKLLWYSRAWIGINWRRMAEQRRKAAQQGS